MSTSLHFAGKANDPWLALIIHSMTRWDAIHFLSIDEHRYRWEHQLAFFPGFIIIVCAVCCGVPAISASSYAHYPLNDIIHQTSQAPISHSSSLAVALHSVLFAVETEAKARAGESNFL
jgi:hypothetical protein